MQAAKLQVWWSGCLWSAGLRAVAPVDPPKQPDLWRIAILTPCLVVQLADSGSLVDVAGTMASQALYAQVTVSKTMAIVLIYQVPVKPAC